MAQARTGGGSISKNPDDIYAVTLPVPEDQLKEFLSGLLGKPQTIDRQLAGPFKVTRSDIEDVHVLLDQRLNAQNKATLASFVARIVYNDNSSVQLNSFLEFQTYNEVKPLRSQAVHVSWTYLIQFRNKTLYEKQQIDLSFTVGDGTRELRIDAETMHHAIVSRGNWGSINFRISHTDRSWGGDIDALLAGRLQHLMREKNATKKCISDHSGKIGFFVSASVFVMALIAVYLAVTRINAEYVAGIRSLEKLLPSVEVVSQTLRLLSNYLVSGGAGGLMIACILFVLLSAVGAVAAGVWVSERATYYPLSYLILTKLDDEFYKQAGTETDWALKTFIASAIASIVLGVLSNLLFYYVTKWWALN